MASSPGFGSCCSPDGSRLIVPDLPVQIHTVAVFTAAGCLRLLHIRFLHTPGNFANGSLQQNALSSTFMALIRWFLPLLMLLFAHNPK